MCATARNMQFMAAQRDCRISSVQRCWTYAVAKTVLELMQAVLAVQNILYLRHLMCCRLMQLLQLLIWPPPVLVRVMAGSAPAMITKSAQPLHAKARMQPNVYGSDPMTVTTCEAASAMPLFRTCCCSLGLGWQSIGLESASTHSLPLLLTITMTTTMTVTMTATISVYLRFSSGSEAGDLKHPRQILADSRTTHSQTGSK